MRALAFLAAAGLIGLAGFAPADDKKTDEAKLTKVKIDDLDCPTCAKALVKVVLKLPGVEKAEADVEKQILTITPKGDKKPSPKEIWEAIEKEGYTPVKLEGPDGKFEKKPTV